MDFLTNISKYEAQGTLNGWMHESLEQYPPYLESRLFCDWASELRILFPHLIHNQFVCSQKFERWVELLTRVQRIIAFNKAMVSHKLQEVKHLFVRSISFYCSTLFETNEYSLTRNSGCWYTWTIYLVYIQRYSWPCCRGNQDSGVIHPAKVATPGSHRVQRLSFLGCGGGELPPLLPKMQV